MLSTEIKTQRPIIKKTGPLEGDITAMVEISGTVNVEGQDQGFKGIILFCWPISTYLKMAGAMLMAAFEEFSDEIADVGVELANIIMTNVKKDLKSLGYNANMNNPTLLKGQDHSIPYPPNSLIISIPITCDHGPFSMEFCYKEEGDMN